jgi:glycosyltransferase involved in cell wall biosynthesis
MRIVIDLQGAQSPGSRGRGIGRYSESLTKAIIKNKGQHEIFLVLNGFFSQATEEIIADFAMFLPRKNIRVWNVPQPTAAIGDANELRRRSAELIREAYLSELDPDVILITSLFEGLVDDSVLSVGKITNTPTAVVIYDLIPYINRKIYLKNQVTEIWYEQKVNEIKRADLLLSISESSRQEALKYLAFEDSSVVNISTAADDIFKPKKYSKAQKQVLFKKFGILERYVMYTGGIDHRKNIEGLIHAYSELDVSIRQSTQLAIVCSIQDAKKVELLELAKEYGMQPDELVLTGFISEEDLIALYNLCDVFIFPSWHEGFGLPALEAMACGAAVIGSNTSSLPEVIGLNEAMFDPLSKQDITEKLHQVLTDINFKNKLKAHGAKQVKNFSWDKIALTAISALERLYEDKNKSSHHILNTPIKRKKLAFVSPLPPERSGISDYSADILPELSRFYDIDVIVNQDEVETPWIKANCNIYNVEWFKNNYYKYERVIYQFGNSHLHAYMFDLIKLVPGIVVLHDFFLGHVTEYMGAISGNEFTWPKSLYESHGYPALYDRYHADISQIAWKYPSNLGVLQNSLGIIVHSEFSKTLAKQWYEANIIDNWSVIPHLRLPVKVADKAEARKRLGIDQNDFIVCSFGFLGAAKCNLELIHAWQRSELGAKAQSRLIFVGENDSGTYAEKINKQVDASATISITGWTSFEQFFDYLSAADLAVQLRTNSRGEVSGAVMHAMSYGLPTIVNANGSMGDIPDHAVYKLNDDFNTDDLVKALDTLSSNNALRSKFSKASSDLIKQDHSPAQCAKQYFESTERFYNGKEFVIDNLPKKLLGIESKLEPIPFSDLARSLAQFKPNYQSQRLLVDISVLAQHDAKSGIQRVVRGVLKELLLNPPQGYRVEPIRLKNDSYYYAREYTSKFLECPENILLLEEIVDFYNTDTFLGLDLSFDTSTKLEFLKEISRNGTAVYFVLYDLLPVLMPEVFPDNIPDVYYNWLNTIAELDGIICISKTVADELVDWLDQHGPKRKAPLNVGWFHIAADLHNSNPSFGLPRDTQKVISKLQQGTSFLSVGTLEPRKGQSQILDGFDQLWQQSLNVNLVFIGKVGWNMQPFISRLRAHAEFGKRLFWLDAISDEYLQLIYKNVDCLINASLGEGFGLPLIEAGYHNLPIICRDIAVFREVAGNSAYYFSGFDASAVSNSIKKWMLLKDKTQFGKIPSLTWQQSTTNLLNVFLEENWYKQWLPKNDNLITYNVNHPAVHTQVGSMHAGQYVTAAKEGHLLYGPFIGLPLGQYELKIFGEVKEKGFPQSHADVSVSSGTQILAHQYLDNANNNIIAHMQLDITEKVEGLEVRVWVPSDAYIKVRGYTLLLINADQGKTFLVVDPRLQSAVGTIKNGQVSTSGKSGHLLFGPFIPLAKGSYTIDVVGKCTEIGKLAYIDIATNSGSQILTKIAIQKQDGDMLMQLPLDLSEDVEGLEVRIYVSEDTEMYVKRINIYPANSEMDEEDSFKTIGFKA